MCKCAGVAGIKKEKVEDVWLFMMALGDIMSAGNEDGIGYAAIDAQNKIFGERWLLNKTWFRDLSKNPRIKQNMLQNIYNFFGEAVHRDQAKSIILHTRYATSPRGMNNTHPFVDDQDVPQAAVIHNGGINNHHKFKKVFSTCDSEVIVHEYLKEKANEDATNISNFTRKFSGWFTCLALSLDGEKKPIMDVFSDTGRLSSVFIPELDVRIYSTDRADIERAAGIFEYKTQKPERMDAETFFRINADTGEITQQGEIDVMISYGPQTQRSCNIGAGVYEAAGNFDDPSFVANWMNRGKGGSDV